MKQIEEKEQLDPMYLAQLSATAMGWTLLGSYGKKWSLDADYPDFTFEGPTLVVDSERQTKAMFQPADHDAPPSIWDPAADLHQAWEVYQAVRVWVANEIIALGAISNAETRFLDSLKVRDALVLAARSLPDVPDPADAARTLLVAALTARGLL